MPERERHEPERIASIFEAVVDLTGVERDTAVRESCAGDPSLERDVRELLAHHDSESSLPELPPLTTTGASPPRDEGALPAEIGPYQVLEKIAEGGMGTVYLAEQQPPMRRRVAVKVLETGLDSGQVIARFEGERQALAMMDHANIARVFDGGMTEQGRPYFAMEYVPGEPLTTFCDREGMSLRQRLGVFLKVCRAVEHAHQKGVIHRDLKPSNVLVTDEDGAAQPKVIDFGIAKALDVRLTEETLRTALGLVIGTPEYMSPEQAEGKADIDTRSDVYALGVLLYELLVGCLPFDRERLRSAGISEALRILRDEQPPRPSTRLSSLEAGERRRVASERTISEIEIRRELERDLDWIVLRALERDRDRRYGSASELAADLERYLAGEAVEAGPPSLRYRMGKFVRRHRPEVVGAAMLALVLLASAVVVGLQAQRLRRALEDSRRQAQRAEAVSELLVDAFRDADPTRRTVDREVTAREVLERSAERLDDPSLPADVRSALLTSMGEAFLGLDDLDRAEDVAERARREGERVGGEPLVKALILSAQVERSRSRHEAAIEHAQRAVDLADETDASATVRVRARQALAAGRQGIGDFDGAETVLVEAQRISGALAGGVVGLRRGNLLLARSQNALMLADYERALDLGRGALAELEESSRNPIHWIQARGNMAIALYELGRLQEAIEVSAESYRIARERLGDEHPYTRQARDNYALRLHHDGRGREALRHFEESVAMSRRIDPAGALLPSELNNLGLIQQGLDLLSEAEATFREAIELQVALVGKDHPNPGYHRMNLGRVLHDAGLYEEGERHYRDALELWQRLLPPEHTLIGNVKVWYGGLLAQTGRADQGKALIEEGLTIRDRDRGRDDWQTAEARSWLGVALAELGEHERAETLLVEAYEPIMEQRGEGWRRTRWALRRILAFYDLVGDAEAFRRWTAEHERHWGPVAKIDPSRRWLLPAT